jgi:hypothetical protein
MCYDYRNTGAKVMNYFGLIISTRSLFQQPTTNNQQPTTHNRKPTTDNPQLTTDYLEIISISTRLSNLSPLPVG